MQVNNNLVNAQYSKALKKWRLVEDCVNDDVKSKAISGADYNGQAGYILGDGQTPRTDKGFECYALRPSFDNYVGNTLDVLMGAMFFKDYEFKVGEFEELPESIAYIEDNADGSGLGFQDHLFEVGRAVASVGRVGVWCVVMGDNSESAQANQVPASARIFKAEDITDWSETIIDGVKRLNYVQLKEAFERVVRDGDAFSKECYNVTYELFLDEDGLYGVYIDDQSQEGSKGLIEPTDGAGNRMDYIPFYFCGATNNKPDIGQVPLYKISDINIALYNADAANAQMIQLYALPLMSFSLNDGVDPQTFIEVNNVKGGNLRVSNAAYVGCDISMAQINSSTVGIEYSKDKIDRMAQLGAQIITVGQNETAEAARIRKSSGLANLTQMVDNIQEMYYSVIACQMRLNNANGEADDFMLELNRKFFDDRITPQMLQQLIAMKYQGAYNSQDMWKVLKDNGLTQTETPEDFDELNGSDIAARPINPDAEEETEE